MTALLYIGIGVIIGISIVIGILYYLSKNPPNFLPW